MVWISGRKIGLGDEEDEREEDVACRCHDVLRSRTRKRRRKEQCSLGIIGCYRCLHGIKIRRREGKKGTMQPRANWLL